MENSERNCKHCKNFRCLFKDTIMEELDLVERMDLDPGFIIYEKGFDVRNLYAVQKGSVQEYLYDADCAQEASDCHHDGQVFGYRDFSSWKHVFGAIALEKSLICRINRSALLEVCKVNVDLSLKMAFFFSEKLNNSERRLTNNNHG